MSSCINIGTTIPPFEKGGMVVPIFMQRNQFDQNALCQAPKKPSKHLLVARDRGHVRALLKEYPSLEIITASAFFDMVRLFAFNGDHKLERDDHAVELFLSNHLVNHPRYSQALVQQFSSLYSACYHGTSSPSQIYETIKDQPFLFVPVFLVLKNIEEAMRKNSLVNGVAALFLAWQLITERKVLPLGFMPTMNIALFHLVDLTLLEIEVIKALSRLGVKFTLHFPLDLERRGINAAVDFIARQFENSNDLTNIEINFDDIAPDGPLKPLIQQLFCDDAIVSLSPDFASVNLAHDVIGEAHLIAKKVAYIKSKEPECSIVVATRSLDSRSTIYQRSLSSFGISIRDRKGVTLLLTPAGSLLTTLFNARSNALAKKDLVGLINHPLFVLSLADDKERSGIMGLVGDLAIDDRVLLAPFGKGRFLGAINRLGRVLNKEDERLDILVSLEAWLDRCLYILQNFPEQASLREHLNILITVLDEAIIGEDPSIKALKIAVCDIALSSSLQQEDDAQKFPSVILFRCCRQCCHA